MEASSRALSERRRREERQLEARPLCSWCLQQGKIVVATIADRASPADDTLQSLCYEWFARKRASGALGYVDDAVGLDGYPVDPNHPFNRKPR